MGPDKFLAITVSLIGGALIPFLTFFGGFSEKKSIRARLTRDISIWKSLPEATQAKSTMLQVIERQTRALDRSFYPNGFGLIATGIGLISVAWNIFLTYWLATKIGLFDQYVPKEIFLGWIALIVAGLTLGAIGCIVKLVTLFKQWNEKR